MADFNVRSDSINVEQIMEQIRARIREKRGVDYTDEQIRELATVKLQKFLDPRGVRSDLIEEFRRARPSYEPPELPNYAFEDNTLFDSHRGALRLIRRLLQPILKLFFNPNPLIQALNIQARLNTMLAEREARQEASRRATEALYYELVHNLVVETTRLGIEVKNLTMRVESLASRLEFNERRARALESVVAYKPAPEDAGVGGSGGRESGTGEPTAVGAESRRSAPPVPGERPPQGDRPPYGDRPPQGDRAPQGEGPGQRSRRRRRRRGRRGGEGSAAAVMAAHGSPAATPGQSNQVQSPAPAETHSAPAETPAQAEGPSDKAETPGAPDDSQ